MREDDYINATDLGKIMCIRATLKMLEPISISNVVYDDEYKMVLNILSHWQDRSHNLLCKDKSEKWLFNNSLTG